MKSLLLLGCTVWCCGCGSSSSGTPPAGQQAQATPANQSQSFQQPTDSVPPVNTQQAPANSQTPPANAEQPPSQASCDQVAAALRNAGCTVSDADLAECEAGTAAGVPCSQQIQALFACLVHGVVCNADGSVNAAGSCPSQNDALNTCLQSVVAQPSCTAASGCTNCANACATCQCDAILVPSVDCTSFCTTTN